MTDALRRLLALGLAAAAASPAMAAVPSTHRAAPSASAAPIVPAKAARDFTLHFDHQLGADEARRRVKAAIDLLRQRFGDKLESSEVTWNEYDADIRVKALSQSANGHIAIGETGIDVRVHLPLLLSPFADQIRRVLDKAAVGALG